MLKYKYRSAVLGCARWEVEAITEWVVHNLSCGFDHVYIYCNDDDPTAMYKKLLPFMVGSQPSVTFVHNPFQGNQAYSIKHFYRNYAAQVEWIAVFDIDEFICLKKWNSIGELLQLFNDDADAIYFNWLNFGPNGYKERPASDVLPTYIRRAQDLHILTKHITRTISVDYEALHNVSDNMNHHWFPPFSNTMRLKNVIGDDMAIYWGNFLAGTREKYFIEDPSRSERIIEAGVLHHYFLKSEADFERRVLRGLEGGMGDQKVWSNMSGSDTTELLRRLDVVEDRCLADRWEQQSALSSSMLMVPLRPGPNIALHKFASQSSLGPDTKGANPADDATGAINGRITGGIGFSTDYESGPWWQVDLVDQFGLVEVRIFNRLGNREIERRSKHIELLVSRNGSDWDLKFANNGEPFGGLDGRPLIIPMNGAVARWIMLRCPDLTYLHLDEVEIYGERI